MIEDQKQALTELLTRALSACGLSPEPIRLERPKQAGHGDLATTIALQCAKKAGKNPRELAAALVEAIKQDAAFSDILSDVEIAGPGFINFRFSQEAKVRAVRDVLRQGSAYGTSKAFEGKSVLLEYVSANPTGPLHLGHARQGALGDVLSRIMATQGYRVMREFYYNDAGVQIHNLTISVQARAKELAGEQTAEDFPENGYHGDYIVDIARDYCAKKPVVTTTGETIESTGDTADLECIRRYSVAYLRNEQDSDLKQLGVAFDNFYLESSLYTDGRVQKAVDAAIEAIKANSQAVNGSADIARVGTVSSGDEEIGKLIAEAMEKVTAAGVITIEESKTAETGLDVVEGMQFDRGYISPYMVTDTDKMEAVVDDPYLLITDKKISSIQDILPVLEQIVKAGQKLVIIAEDVEGDALSTLLVNRLRGSFNCVCVKAPGFGDRRKEMLRDIAILTGGTYFANELNMNLQEAQLSDLGRARQIKVNKDTTVIVDGCGNSEDIQNRIHEIKAAIGVTTSEYDREKLQERLAKLSGGVAVIRVGAQTETAMKEQKLRVEDALNATRAAVEEGIVAGGGTAFVNAIPAVEKLVAKLSGDEKTGASIIVKALQAPVRQIAENAGVDGSVVFEKIKNSRKVGFGYNAYNATYCDMIPAGIVDPTKVTRTALENAASIGACVLTTESIVADKPDPAADAAAAAAANAGGMGGMY